LALGIDVHPRGTGELEGTDYWRLRVGDLRVIYLVDDDGTVVVLRVARRSERMSAGALRDIYGDANDYLATERGTRGKVQA
jgi:hypothetical protein